MREVLNETRYSLPLWCRESVQAGLQLLNMLSAAERGAGEYKIAYGSVSYSVRLQ